MLDIFAGTGAVGLEALSRGAERIVFVERDQACIKAITRNLAKFGFEAKARICRADVTRGLAWLKHYAGPEGYDMIFLGPPYRDQKNVMLSLTGPTLAFISEGELLAKDGIIIAQHHMTEEFDVPAGYELYRSEKYGDTLVDLLHRVRK
jgi:16S rRNA (guanine(966)-N(2))-methyltransferase RsmD